MLLNIVRVVVVGAVFVKHNAHPCDAYSSLLFSLHNSLTRTRSMSEMKRKMSQSICAQISYNAQRRRRLPRNLWDTDTSKQNADKSYVSLRILTFQPT